MTDDGDMGRLKPPFIYLHYDLDKDALFTAFLADLVKDGWTVPRILAARDAGPKSADHIELEVRLQAFTEAAMARGLYRRTES